LPIFDAGCRAKEIREVRTDLILAMPVARLVGKTNPPTGTSVRDKRKADSARQPRHSPTGARDNLQVTWMEAQMAEVKQRAVVATKQVRLHQTAGIVPGTVNPFGPASHGKRRQGGRN
jgi:hypothetical protein